MKKPNAGTEQPKAFVVEFGASWRRWAKRRSDSELERINHQNVFEFRVSRGLRVVFLVCKPNRLYLLMTGSHDEVRAWLKENV